MTTPVQPQTAPGLSPDRWPTSGVGGIGTASLLADVGHGVPTALLPSLLTSTLGASAAYGRACGFERTMDNLGAIFGPLLAPDHGTKTATTLALGLHALYNIAATLASLPAGWTTTSPRAAFGYLAARMLLALAGLTLASRRSHTGSRTEAPA